MSADQKQQAIDTHSRQAGEFEAGYSAAEQDPYRSCFAYSRKRLDFWLDRLLPSAPGTRLLDVGCGTGHHMFRLRQRGLDVSGVDGSEEMLARARSLNPGADLRVGDVETLPFADATFDATLSIEVLRYLPDPTRCIAEMARVLKPGGTCVATALPLFNLNGFYVINRLATVRPVAGLVPLRQFFTTSGTLRRQFEAAGFEAVEIHGVYFGPVNWVERLAERLLPRALRAWEPIDARVADSPVRELANMFVLRARRRSVA